MRRVFRAGLCLILALGVLLGSAPSAPTQAANSDVYAGWAMDAYPDLSAAAMQTTLQRMRDGGANLVWIGQPNPANVNPQANEVGLSYAVYAALQNPSDPQNAAAQSIVAAQKRMLDAARSVGMPVVLPIGYRTQMGSTWNQGHLDSLRRGPDGTILNFGGVDASPYAGAFRTDMASYYQWIESTFVAPYRDVITMINLCDEPTGVDYSGPADATFAARYGYHFSDVGSDPQRETQLGDFQSHVMVDFATWAAQKWQSIDPAMTVTISFDGTPGRKSQQAPAITDIFRETPPNLQPTFDALLRNGTPSDALNDSDLTALSVLIGTVAHDSAEYHRPYWLWSAGNSWGLGQGSNDPSSIADALVNLHLHADLSRQGGGLLRGIAIWSYNVRGQGLYNDQYHTSYNPDDLFNRLTGRFPAIRQILRGPAGPGADAIILAPNKMPDFLIGQSRLVDVWSFEGYNFGDLISLVRSGANPAVVDTLAGQNLSQVRMLVVLARMPSDLTDADVAAIHAYRAAGGTVVDAQTVESVDHFGAQWVWPGNAPEGFFSKDYTLAHTGPVAALGSPRLTNSFTIVGPQEILAYGGTEMDSAAAMRAYVHLPYAVPNVAYGLSGTPISQLTVGPGLVSVPTIRHTFTLLSLGTTVPVVASDPRMFPQTGFRIDNDTIWDYFKHRGGLRTFGYPVSRTFLFEGFQVQFFQREIVQIGPDGGARILNLLDPGLLPYQNFNFADFPASDPGIVDQVPTVGQPGYGANVLSFVHLYAPDTWNGLPVGFSRRFFASVNAGDAYPNGGGNLGLLPGFDLELWGVPTSAPAYDPHNHGFVYLRFQRGIMMYDASCHCTQGVLLADYLKSVITGKNVPADLNQEAQDSRFYHQYDPTRPGWVRDPSALPGTDFTNAFEPE